MGSLRRGLTLALLPTPALAEVCDKVRPGWDPAAGPATQWSEALFLASSLPSVVLIVATLLAVRFRSAWGGLAAVCGWSLMIGFLVFGNRNDPTGLHQLARNEGCIASPSLFIAVVAAICIAMILYTTRRDARH